MTRAPVVLVLLLLLAAAPLARPEAPHAIGEPELIVLASEADDADVPIALVRPVGAEGPVPVIAFASPYLYTGVAPDQIVKSSQYKRLALRYVPEGYAVAFIPVRGTASAGGCSDLMGPLERADLDLAIRWLGQQAWSNGRVGMVGVSYDGSTPWEVASMGNPYLKTIVPISGVNDMHQLMYGDGVPEARGTALLNAIYYVDGFSSYTPTNGRSAEKMAASALCPEAWAGLVASIESSRTGERDAGGFFAARNLRPGVEANYSGSIFLVHGLQDWNVDPSHDFPWVPTLEARGLDVKYLLSQGGHSWPDSTGFTTFRTARADWPDMLGRWFARELKGDATVDVGPKVEVQDSSGQWRAADAWPPAVAPERQYLTSDGRLAAEDATLPAHAIVSVTGGYQGVGPWPCVTCAKFVMPSRAETWRFAGSPTLDATVVPTGVEGRVSVTLYSQYGSLFDRVGWGTVDLRFPEGGEEARPVTPGEPVRVRVTLEPLDVAIRPNARLLVIVHNGGHGDHDGGAAPLLLETGGARAWLDLPVHAPDRASFFAPP